MIADLGLRVTIGTGFACALDRTAAQVKCWGSAEGGALGLGDGQDRGGLPNQMGAALPVVDLGGAEPIDISAGSSHACVRTTNEVLCWGANSQGQLGNATHVFTVGDEAGDCLLYTSRCV